MWIFVAAVLIAIVAIVVKKKRLERSHSPLAQRSDRKAAYRHQA